ncbi:MAG: hypothetical protein JXQ73_31220 [Phycisphaerae bacterium]|nr:hypothetical protein [Phycisphaerae bacterium]
MIPRNAPKRGTGFSVLLASAAIGLMAACGGCVSMDAHPQGAKPAIQGAVQLVSSQTADGIGKCQGVEVRDGFVYLYGDAETGVIRQYTLSDGPPKRLVYTGLEIRLTRNGQDLISHPTGLTFHPRYGAFLGDSVKNKGVIYHVDWQRMLEDRNLDRAVLNVVDDDLAVSGTRPEFLRINSTWYVATADYRDWGNWVRLYDPAKLAAAHKTSEPEVLRDRYPCGSHVQNLSWVDEREILILVQNWKDGNHWRLTFVEPCCTADFRDNKSFDAFAPVDELEGFHPLPDQWCVMVSSSLTDNVWFGKVTFPSRAR